MGMGRLCWRRRPPVSREPRRTQAGSGSRGAQTALLTDRRMPPVVHTLCRGSGVRGRLAVRRMSQARARAKHPISGVETQRKAHAGRPAGRTDFLQTSQPRTQFVASPAKENQRLLPSVATGIEGTLHRSIPLRAGRLPPANAARPQAFSRFRASFSSPCNRWGSFAVRLAKRGMASAAATNRSTIAATSRTFTNSAAI
jgi:hypothetical protein